VALVADFGLAGGLFGVFQLAGFGFDHAVADPLDGGHQVGAADLAGMYSTVAFSVARLTVAATTPGTFLLSVRSMVAEQLAQVIPVIGNSTLAVATP